MNSEPTPMCQMRVGDHPPGRPQRRLELGLHPFDYPFSMSYRLILVRIQMR